MSLGYDAAPAIALLGVVQEKIVDTKRGDLQILLVTYSPVWRGGELLKDRLARIERRIRQVPKPAIQVWAKASGLEALPSLFAIAADDELFPGETFSEAALSSIVRTR